MSCVGMRRPKAAGTVHTQVRVARHEFQTNSLCRRSAYRCSKKAPLPGLS